MGAEVKSMEIKKSQQTSATTDSTISKKKVQDFVSDLKGEIYKVQWTNKEELLIYTKIVIATTFVFGMMIYLTDLLIQGTLIGLSSLLRLIAG